MNEEATNIELKGYDGNILLTPYSIVLKRGGIKGMVLGGSIRGDKTVPYSNIAAIQLKKAGLTAGYLQITVKGGSESKGGLFQSTRDGDCIHFYYANNKKMEEGKQIIEKRMFEVASGKSPVPSSMDELEKLSSLKDKGIITQEEFDAKKKQLLGI